jgi:hypothetical protein
VRISSRYKIDLGLADSDEGFLKKLACPSQSELIAIAGVFLGFLSNLSRMC